ncbi:MAG: DUF5677 domain-containing protein [Candidatus Latescibacter sp.]|nr:DUF5677 domain-containing protein [Candidatus Latescibacter sp.]
MSYKIINGFLGQEFSKEQQTIRQEHREVLSFARDINRFCFELLTDMRLDTKQKTSVCLLFVKSLEIYQASIVLIERGLVSASRVLVRCLIDSLGLLVCCTKYDTFLEKYENSYEHDRLHLMKIAKKLDKEQKYNINNVDLEEELRKLSNRIINLNYS